MFLKNIISYEMPETKVVGWINEETNDENLGIK